MHNTPVYLDLDTWPRRSAFELFRGYDIPCFNLCTRVDVAQLKKVVKELGIGTMSLAYHYIAIRLGNEIEPFRYRLEGDRVRIHEVVHGGTTVLREDESIGFATLEYQRNFSEFAKQGAATLAHMRRVDAPFEPTKFETATLHMSAVPWVHFTSNSNARIWGAHDSIPKIAFGRIDADGDHLWMPLSVEVHHALMDGLHVGRYIQGFEAALRDPMAWLTQT